MSQNSSWLAITVVSSNFVVRLQNTLPSCFAGCVPCFRSDLTIELGRRRYKWASLAFWMCLVVFAMSLPQVIGLFADVSTRLTGDPWPFPFHLLATGCLFVPSIMAVPRLLTNRFAGFLGRISFSFYLLHFYSASKHEKSNARTPLARNCTRLHCHDAALKLHLRRHRNFVAALDPTAGLLPSATDANSVGLV